MYTYIQTYAIVYTYLSNYNLIHIYIYIYVCVRLILYNVCMCVRRIHEQSHTAMCKVKRYEVLLAIALL